MPLIPTNILAQADKILFIVPVQLSHFLYLQNYLRAFALAHPHIKIDLLLDHHDKTRLFWRWKHLKKHVVFDLLINCPFIHYVYKDTHSPGAFKRSLHQARLQHYPIVVSLMMQRPHVYARHAHTISPAGVKVGIRVDPHWTNIVRRWYYKKQHASLPYCPVKTPKAIVTDTYTTWFNDLFDLPLSPADEMAQVTIPNKWVVYGKLHLLKLGIDKRSKKFSKVLFINPGTTSHKNSWPFERVIEFICAIKKYDAWGDVSFIINVLPVHMHQAQKFFSFHAPTNTYLFCASHNIFQLMSVMALVDIVISIDGALVHLANALARPIVVLAGLHDDQNYPIKHVRNVITTLGGRGSLAGISTADIVQAVQGMSG